MEKANIKQTFKWFDDLTQIMKLFLKDEWKHFYLVESSIGKIHLTTSWRYKKANNEKHPLEFRGRKIVKHYYKFGKENTIKLIEEGGFD